MWDVAYYQLVADAYVMMDSLVDGRSRQGPEYISLAYWYYAVRILLFSPFCEHGLL